MKERVEVRFALIATLAVAAITAARAGDGVSSAKKREIFAGVHRIAIVPPFFGADQDDRPDDNTHQDETLEFRKLLDHEGDNLPRRVAARTPYSVISISETLQALSALNLKPERLFKDDGKMKGGRFALPDASVVKKLAAVLRADVVMLATLDEPIKKGAKYSIDPLSGVTYQSPHISSKAAFFVLQADGTEVLHDYVEALRPLSRGKQRGLVLADWQDASDTVVEDFLDELTRYTPAPK